MNPIRRIEDVIKYNPTFAAERAEWTGEKLPEAKASKAAAPKFGKKAAK